MQSEAPEHPAVDAEGSAHPTPAFVQVTGGTVGVCVDGVTVQNAVGASGGALEFSASYATHEEDAGEVQVSVAELQAFEKACDGTSHAEAAQNGELEAKNPSSQWAGPTEHVHVEHSIAGAFRFALADRTMVGAAPGHDVGAPAVAPA
jgi:hypothetical protein